MKVLIFLVARCRRLFCSSRQRSRTLHGGEGGGDPRLGWPAWATASCCPPARAAQEPGYAARET